MSDRGEFLIVGLGASAGGVDALQTFFTHVPADSGMAYVVILHLSPDYESHLAQVLQTSAAIPVTQVAGEVRVEPNHAYVIPPNRSLSMRDGHLSLSEVRRVEERRAPVDVFFRTLATSHGARAACVVLSGTGADGSMGLKRVKEEGGLCLAQDPDEAEYNEMPRNAMATGFVDQALPVAEMPGRIAAYSANLRRVPLAEDSADRRPEDDTALRDLFGQLRARTGHDFSSYKRGTVRRRIARRMSVHQITELPAYLQLIREQPDESRALLKDLLISVTNFFRDPDAFDVVERRALTRILDGRKAHEQVRVWVAGCATGEEAYSIAMLLAERTWGLPAAPSVQVFATDIDQGALAVAREGLYTMNDAADVTPERLRRFFTKEGDGYRVRRELRETVLFAHHNVLSDPPFAHLDLASCRNLLIYLNRDAQRRVMEVMHFALNPGGYLFLGASESVEEVTELFASVDREAHVFQSRPAPTRLTLPLPDILTRPSQMPRLGVDPPPAEARVRERLSLADVHQRLVEEYAPPSAVVNEDHEIMHLSDRAGRYLQFTGGEPSHNLLRVVRPELRLELRSALYQAAQQRTNVQARGLRVGLDDRTVTLTVTVRPVLREDDPARGFFLVLFEEVEDGAVETPPEPAVRPADSARQIEDELVRMKGQLRSTVERHETQAEELKASNEELQAMNEELRSSAEELETSKEELQSANEEMQTVNQELKIKVEELTQANDDILNLINSTEIGTLFLDRSSRIKLFTPTARRIFSLIPSDRGRPLSDISSQLVEVDLASIVERVLDRLERQEREVRTREGAWYLMHVVPYRTAEDRIDGVVLTFLDISARKLAEDRLRTSEHRLRLMMESATDYAILTTDEGGLIDGWNAGASRLFGYEAQEAIGHSADLLFTVEDREQGVPDREMRQAREEGRAIDERWHVRKDGSRFFVSGVMTALRDTGGTIIGYAKIARDLTERRQWEETLQEGRDELEERVGARTRDLGMANQRLDHELQERRDAETRVRGLLTRLITVQEDERRRIGRDLHDHLGQQLTALRLKLEALPSDGDGRSFAEALRAVERLDHDLGFLAWELRPASLDDLGLAPTLANFVHEWSANYAIPAEFHTQGLDDRRLGFEVETNLYRIAQEALNNVYKHARAGHAAVMLERRDRHVVLIIEDDGRGFDPQAAAVPAAQDAGLGLIGMRERAAVIGGSLEIESSAGHGTTVFARVPFPPAASD